MYRSAAAALLLLITGCTWRSTVGDFRDFTDDRDMVLLRVTERGIEPSAEVEVLPAGSVAWLNETDGQEIDVEVGFGHEFCES